MIYLTNVSKIKDLPKDSLKLLITRIPIKNFKKYNLHHVSDISPSNQLLYDIKQHKISWKDYVKIFRKELTSINSQKTLNKIETFYYKCDIFLICYCENEKQCHRYIIGNYFKELGYDVKSYE